MSKQKERKLKRIRKQRVWTKVLGIVMTIAVFFVLAVVILLIFAISVVFNKVQQGYNDSSEAVQIIEEEWDIENQDSLNKICENILKNDSSIKDICIVDSDDKIVYQYGEETPNFEWNIEALGNGNTKFIMTDDEESFIYTDNNLEAGLRIEEVLRKIASNNNEESDNNFLESKKLTMINFWYEIPLSDENYSVCIKNELPVRQMEIIFVEVVMEIMLLFAMILIIYYLSSLLGLVLERRKHVIMMTTDIVTGGNNLQYFVKEGNKLLKKNKRGKYNYAVVAIRMEKYRNFCSCYGVKEGEELLEGFSLALKENLYKKEILAHAEKADFALLLVYETEEELVARIKKMISKMDSVKAGQKKYFSAGIYKVQNSCDGIDSMYNYAGVAINVINEDSEERIVWFNDEMQSEQLWIRKVENDMEKALINKEFQVYLQPKYSTKAEVLSGAEALVRWIHPIEGFVPPYRFIPIFESNGFVMQLDDYMLTEVARQQAKWIAEGKKTVPISVNISRVHFIKEDLAEHICQIVDEFNVPHDLIELELTESAFFDDKGVLLNTINKLKSYGFAISMDDFGSGYSSLNSLRELPLDVVKLDAGFFRDSDESGRGKLIVGDTISLAKKLDMKIVAEGIETRDQVDFLATMDCDLIQGYYFAKPMPISEFEEKAFG